MMIAVYTIAILGGLFLIYGWVFERQKKALKAVMVEILASSHREIRMVDLWYLVTGLTGKEPSIAALYIVADELDKAGVTVSDRRMEDGRAQRFLRRVGSSENNLQKQGQGD